MKTILTLSVGFWIGRQVYINYNREQTQSREAAIKKQLEAVFRKYNMKAKGVREQVERIFKN